MAIAMLLLLAGLPLLVAMSLAAARRPMLLLALYVAVVPFGSSIGIPGLSGPFGTLSTVLGLLASGVLLLHLVVGRDRARSIVVPLPLWILVGAASVATVAWSIDRATTVEGIAVLASLLGLYVVASLVDVTPDDVRRIGSASILAGAAVGVLAVVQLATGTMYVEPGSQTERFTLAGGGGEVGDANITAAGLLLPLAIAGFRATDRGREGRSRLLHAVGSLLMLAAVLLTGSRGGLIAVLAMGAVLLLQDPSHRPRLRYLLVPAVAVAVLFAAAPDNLQSRLADASSTGRSDIWKIGLAACDDHCLLGSGWGTFGTVHARGLLTSPDRTGWVFGYEAHNVWLQMLIEVGITGLVLLMAAIAASYRELLRLPAGLRGPPLVALTGLLTANVFLSNLDFKYFWLTLLYVNLCIIAATRAAPVGTGSRPTGPEPTPRTDALAVPPRA